MTGDASTEYGAQSAAGSPVAGEPVFLVVGLLRRPHGVRGEMVMDMLTDFPERLRRGARVYVGDQRQPMTIRQRRPYDRGALISFLEIETPEAAASFRKTYLYVRSDEIPALQEGEYYHHQVLGLRVVSDDGALVGKLVDIIETGSNDVYVVQPDSGPEVLLPVIDEVVLAVDLKGGEIKVHLLPGLLAE
jgi:16S rRNA processing protein RimM